MFSSVRSRVHSLCVKAEKVMIGKNVSKLKKLSGVDRLSSGYSATEEATQKTREFHYNYYVFSCFHKRRFFSFGKPDRNCFSLQMLLKNMPTKLGKMLS